MQAGNKMQVSRLRKVITGITGSRCTGVSDSSSMGIAGILLTSSLLMASPAALAVKMGQVSDTSLLSKPLDVSIELTQLNGLGADDLAVSFGSADDFTIAGIDYSPYLEAITIEVLVTGYNTGRIRLTSESPLNEPYLSFLLQLRSRDGLVIKEYSVLPQLPVFSTPSRDAVQSASSSSSVAGSPASGSGQASSVTQDESSLNIPSSVGQRSTSTSVSQPGGGEYIIQAGDTLWAIAQQVRPSEDISVQQTMIALQQANPQAFPSGNINNIRPLAVLRVPTGQEILALNSSDAIAEVQRQNRVSEGLEAEPLVMNETDPAEGLEAESDELSVVSADEALTSGADGSGSQTSTQLENEILLAEETIDRLTVENEELESRITELSSQIELLEDMVTVKDEQIAELNQQAADLASENQGQAALLDSSLASEPEDAGSGNMVDKLVSSLQNNLNLVAAAGGVILLFILGLMYYRRRSVDDESGEQQYDETDSPEEEDELSDIINTGAVVPDTATMTAEEDADEAEENESSDRDTTTETVYEVDDVEDTLADEDLDGIDDDFYSIIQVDEEDLARVTSEGNKGEAREPAAAERDADREELLDVLSRTDDDMKPNLDLQEESGSPQSSEEDSRVIPDTADEISSAINELDEPGETGENSGDAVESTDEFSDEYFSNITFDEDHVIDVEGDESGEADDSSDQEAPSSSIDLAVAYEAMGDINGARELLQKALFEGSEEERIQARNLLDEWKEK